MVGKSTPGPVLVTVVVAALVAVAALTTVAVLRADGDRQPAPKADPAAPASNPASDCGPSPCSVVASAALGDTPVELLTAADGGAASRLRIGGPTSNVVAAVTLTERGVRLNQDSLRCATGAVPVCLVRGANSDGVLGQLLVARGDVWQAAGRLFFSDAGTVLLDTVTGPAPEIVVVRHDCPVNQSVAKCQVAPVVAEVFDIAGNQLGCTQQYNSPSQLPGWPEVKLRATQLHPCT